MEEIPAFSHFVTHAHILIIYEPPQLKHHIAKVPTTISQYEARFASPNHSNDQVFPSYSAIDWRNSSEFCDRKSTFTTSAKRRQYP
jgi:hypothetical protein